MSARQRSSVLGLIREPSLLRVSFRMLVAASVLLLAFVGQPGNAAAESVGTERQRNMLRSKQLGIDLHILEQREQRRDFMERQQRLRDQDRDRSVRRDLNLGVQRYRPGCQQPIDGNAYMRGGCR